MFKVNNKDTSSSVSVVNFEHVMPAATWFIYGAKTTSGVDLK